MVQPRLWSHPALLAATWLLPTLGCTGQHEPKHSPPPTEHILDEDAERENKAGRHAWIEEMHRTAPEVDWRDIELENGRREMYRRKQLAASSFAVNSRHWSEVGSRNQAGRMHCVVIGPDAGNGPQLYAGSALGGLWRGNLDGTGWEPLGDNLYGGVHEAVVIAAAGANDPPVIVILNGDAVYASTDEGASWQIPVGLEDVFDPKKIVTLDDAFDTIVVYGIATVSGSSRSAVFTSTDRGQTFQLAWNGTSNWSGDVWVPRTGAAAEDTIYLLDQGDLLVSNDGGQSFFLRGTIDVSAGTGLICGSEAGAPTLYVALSVSGSYRIHGSLDAGFNFLELHTPSDFWATAFCASILDDGIVMYGGVEAFRSTNYAADFAKANNWWDYYDDPVNKLHADMFGFHCWANPDNPAQEIWYVSCDGGLWESRDSGASWQNIALEGLGVSQYYSTHTSAANPATIVAGSQDQGYQRGTWQPPLATGPSTEFDQLISGDYGHLTSTDGDHDFLYSTYPGFILIQEGENNPNLHTADFPSGASNLWLPPVVADPVDEESFFFLANRLWHYTKTAPGTWTETQHSSEAFSGYLTQLAFAPSDPGRAYAIDSSGNLYTSTDSGVTWTESNDSSPDEHYFYGNAIAVNPDNSLEAMVGGSGYSAVGARRTVDGGVTWEAFENGLPETLVYDLAYSGDGVYVYAATEAGPYRYSTLAGAWQNIAEVNTPLTTYWSVEVLGDGTVRYGTYGRGIWDYTPPVAGSSLLFSVKNDFSLDGINVDDGDIVSLDLSSGTVGLEIDISDVISGNVDTDGFCRLSDGSYLLTFKATETIGGLTGGPNGETVEDEDIVRFVPTSTGPITAGTFEFYLDGSDVGLSPNAHDIDAIAVDDAGNLLLSLVGPWDLGDELSGKDEDILLFVPSVAGASTAGTRATTTGTGSTSTETGDNTGTWSLLLDGNHSNVKLGKNGEDVDALHYDPALNDFSVSTTGDFRVPDGLVGQDNDVITFSASSLDPDFEGSWTLFLEGGFINETIDIDGLHLVE